MNYSTELLNHFEKKAHAFENEREVWLKRIADLEIQNTEIHNLRRELRSRDIEIRDLNANLSDAKLHVHSEREKRLELQAEVDDLRLILEDEQKKAGKFVLTEKGVSKISSSKSLSEPTVLREVVRPLSKAVGRMDYSMVTTENDENEDPSLNGKGSFGRTSKAAAAEISNLKKQVKELKALLEEKTHAFEVDNVDRQERHRIREYELSSKLDMTEGLLKTVKENHTNLTREYLRFRHETLTQNAVYEKEIRELKETLDKEMKSSSDEISQSERVIEQLRHQLDAVNSRLKELLTTRVSYHSDTIKLMNASFEAEKEKLLGRIAALEGAVSTARARADAAESHRRSVAEASARDIASLRDAVKRLQYDWASGVLAEAELGGAGGQLDEQAFAENLNGVADTLENMLLNSGVGSMNVQRTFKPSHSMRARVDEARVLFGLNPTVEQAEPSPAPRAPAVSSPTNSGRLPRSGTQKVSPSKTSGDVGTYTGRETLAGYNPVNNALKTFVEEKNQKDFDLSTKIKQTPSRNPPTTTSLSASRALNSDIPRQTSNNAQSIHSPLQLGVRNPIYTASSSSNSSQSGSPTSHSPEDNAKRNIRGPRRVPVGSPEAAERFDTSLQQNLSIFKSVDADNAESRGSSSSRSGTSEMKHQLGHIRDRLSELSMRASNM